MKIVSFEEFVRMPAGTVYAAFEPDIMGDVYIKTDNGHASGHLWFFSGAMPLKPVIETWGDNKAHTNEIADIDISNNEYEPEDRFAIFERGDVERMIAQLKWALSNCESDDIAPYLS